MANKFTIGSGGFGNSGSFGKSDQGTGAGKSRAPFVQFDNLDDDQKTQYQAGYKDWLKENPDDYVGAALHGEDRLFTWQNNSKYFNDQGGIVSGALNTGAKALTPSMQFDDLNDDDKRRYQLGYKSVYDPKKKNFLEAAAAGEAAVRETRLSLDQQLSEAMLEDLGKNDVPIYLRDPEMIRDLLAKNGATEEQMAGAFRPGFTFSGKGAKAGAVDYDTYRAPLKSDRADADREAWFNGLLDTIGGIDNIQDQALKKKAQALQDAIQYRREGAGAWMPTGEEENTYAETLAQLQTYANQTNPLQRYETEAPGLREAAEAAGYTDADFAELTEEAQRSMAQAYAAGGADGVAEWDRTTAEELYGQNKLWRPEGEQLWTPAKDGITFNAAAGSTLEDQRINRLLADDKVNAAKDALKKELDNGSLPPEEWEAAQADLDKLNAGIQGGTDRGELADIVEAWTEAPRDATLGGFMGGVLDNMLTTQQLQSGATVASGEKLGKYAEAVGKIVLNVPQRWQDLKTFGQNLWAGMTNATNNIWAFIGKTISGEHLYNLLGQPEWAKPAFKVEEIGIQKSNRDYAAAQANIANAMNQDMTARAKAELAPITEELGIDKATSDYIATLGSTTIQGVGSNLGTQSWDMIIGWLAAPLGVFATTKDVTAAAAANINVMEGGSNVLRLLAEGFKNAFNKPTSVLLAANTYEENVRELAAEKGGIDNLTSGDYVFSLSDSILNTAIEIGGGDVASGFEGFVNGDNKGKTFLARLAAMALLDEPKEEVFQGLERKSLENVKSAAEGRPVKYFKPVGLHDEEALIDVAEIGDTILQTALQSLGMGILTEGASSLRNVVAKHRAGQSLTEQEQQLLEKMAAIAEQAKQQEETEGQHDAFEAEASGADRKADRPMGGTDARAEAELSSERQPAPTRNDEDLPYGRAQSDPGYRGMTTQEIRRNRVMNSSVFSPEQMGEDADMMEQEGEPEAIVKFARWKAEHGRTFERGTDMPAYNPGPYGSSSINEEYYYDDGSAEYMDLMADAYEAAGLDPATVEQIRKEAENRRANPSDVIFDDGSAESYDRLADRLEAKGADPDVIAEVRGVADYRRQHPATPKEMKAGNAQAELSSERQPEPARVEDNAKNQAETDVRAAELKLREAQTAAAQAIMAANDQSAQAEDRARLEAEAREAVARREEAEREYQEAQRKRDEAKANRIAEEKVEQDEQDRENARRKAEGPGEPAAKQGEQPETVENQRRPEPLPKRDDNKEGALPETQTQEAEELTAQTIAQKPGEPAAKQGEQPETVENQHRPEPVPKRDDNKEGALPETQTQEAEELTAQTIAQGPGEPAAKQGELPETMENQHRPEPVPKREKTELPETQTQEAEKLTAQTIAQGPGEPAAKQGEQPETMENQHRPEPLPRREKTELPETQTQEEEELTAEEAPQLPETEKNSTGANEEEAKQADEINRNYGFNRRNTDGSRQPYQSGLTINTWSGDVDEQTGRELRVIHDYAKEHGFAVVMDSTLRNGKVSGIINGYYDKNEGGGMVIHLAQDGKAPLRTTLGHELYHMISNLNQNGAQRMEKLYRDYARRTGIDIEELVDKKLVRYRNLLDKNEQKARRQALEEVIADGMYDVIGDERTLRVLAMEDRSMAERIRDWAEKVLQDIRRMIDKYGANKAEARVLHEQADAMENMRAVIERALEETKELQNAKKAAKSLGSNSQMLDDYHQMMDAATTREEMNAATLALAGQVLEKGGIEANWDNTRRLMTAALEYASGGGVISQVLNDYDLKTWKVSEEANRAFVSMGRYIKQMLESQDEAGYAQLMGWEPEGEIERKLSATRIRYSVSADTDQEYQQAVDSGDMDKAQEMVNQRAEEMRAQVFAATDVPTYKVRRGPTPKKTIKVYKTFTMDKQGKPSALFVSSQNSIPVGVWLDAQDTFHFTDQSNGRKYVVSTKNPNTKGGATGRQTSISDISAKDIEGLIENGYIERRSDGQLYMPGGKKPVTSLTSLAYRPGWHAGDLPFFPQGGMKIEGSNYENVHRYNQVVFECEMPADIDYTNSKLDTDKKSKNYGKQKYYDRQEMPVNGSYKFATNPMANASDIGAWYISGALKINRALTEEECNEILQEHGYLPQEWQAYQEKGTEEKAMGPLDLDKLGYDPENTEESYKLLDPVTYDDNGNVIPLSQRFNSEIKDPRYSLSDENADINYAVDAEDARDMLDLGSDVARTSDAGWQLINTMRQMKLRETQDEEGGVQRTPGYWKKQVAEIAKSLESYTYGKDQKSIEKAVKELFAALDGYEGDPRGFVDFALREAQGTMRDLYTDERENPTRDNLKAFFAQHGPLYITAEQKKELQYYAGGMTAFRRQAAGMVPITNKKTGIGLEEVWEELAPLIGKDPSIVSVGTMIMEFNDAVEKARSVNGEERTLTDEEMAMLDRRALDLVAEYMEAGATVVPTRTVERIDADKHQQALQEVTRLQEETDRQQEEIDRLNRRLADADNVNQSLNRQLFDKVKQLDQLKKSNATREEVDQARAAYREIAEKSEQAVKDMKALQKKLEAARAKRDEYRRQLAQANKAEQQFEKAQHQIERLKAGRDSLKKQIEQMKLKAMDNRLIARQTRERNKALSSIRKKGGELRTMFSSPSEKKGYIPMDQVRAAADLVESLTSADRSGDAAKMSKRLENALRDARESTDYLTSTMYDEGLYRDMQDVTRLLEEKGSLRNLSNSELNFVDGTLTSIVYQIKTSNETVGRQKNQAVQEEAEDAVKVMRENPKELKGIGRLIRKGILTHLNPQRFYAILGHHGNNAWTRMGEEQSEGQRKANMLTMNMTKTFEGLTRGENEKKFDKFTGKNATWYDTGIQILTETGQDSGRTWKMNGAMRAFFGLSWQSDENREAMRAVGEKGDGGQTLYQLTIPDEELMKKGKEKEAYARGERVYFTAEQAEQIVDDMTDYEKAWMNAWKNMEKLSKNAINETSLLLNGFRKANVSNYVPIFRDPRYIGKEFESVVTDARLTSMGFLKERVNAHNPMMLMDLTNVINRQVRDVSAYYGFAIPTRNATRIYNGKMPGNTTSVKEVINKTQGMEYGQYFEKLMSDLQGGSRVESSPLDRLRGNVAGAVLSGNPSVIIKQAASYPAAASVLGWKPLMKAMKYFNPASLKAMDVEKEIDPYTSALWERRSGKLSDLEANANRNTRMSKFLHKMTNGIQGMDIATTKVIWKACEYYVDEQRTDLKRGTEEYKQAVARVYEEALEQTQPEYGTMQRPQILRSQSQIVKSLTMYKTQSMQNFGILVDAAANLSDKAKAAKANNSAENQAALKAAKTQLATAISSQITSAVILGIMTAVGKALMHKMGDYRDDKGDLTAESVGGQILKDSASSVAGMVAGGSEIFDLINGLFEGKSPFDIEAAGVSTINDLYQNLYGFGEAMKTLGNQDLTDAQKLNQVWPKLRKLGLSVTQMFGLPAQNFLNLLDGVAANAADFATGKGGTFASASPLAIAGTQVIGSAQGRETSNKAVAGYIARAMMDGNQAEATRLYNEQLRQGKTADALNTAIATWQKENIPQIREAAEAIEWGDLAEYNALINELVSMGLSMTNAVKYVEAERGKMQKTDDNQETTRSSEPMTYEDIVSGMTKDESDSQYTNGQMNSLLEYGDIEQAKAIRDEMLKAGKKSSSINSSLTSHWKPMLQAAYQAGDMAEVRRITNMLVEMGMKRTTIAGWTNSAGSSSSSSSKSGFGSKGFGSGSFGSGGFGKKSSKKKSGFGSGSFGSGGFGKKSSKKKSGFGSGSFGSGKFGK